MFLFEQVIGEPVGTIGDFARANRPKRLPVVLSRAEVNRLLDARTGTYRLMAGLPCGGGLRWTACVRLRVKDVDLAHNQIMVRDGKGQKARVSMPPQRFQQGLREQLVRAKERHERIWHRALERFICGPPWGGNTPMPHGNGAGNLCFRRAGCQWTRVVGKCVGIISTKTPCNEP